MVAFWFPDGALSLGPYGAGKPRELSGAPIITSTSYTNTLGFRMSGCLPRLEHSAHEQIGKFPLNEGFQTEALK